MLHPDSVLDGLYSYLPQLYFICAVATRQYLPPAGVKPSPNLGAVGAIAGNSTEVLDFDSIPL